MRYSQALGKEQLSVIYLAHTSVRAHPVHHTPSLKLRQTKSLSPHSLLLSLFFSLSLCPYLILRLPLSLFSLLICSAYNSSQTCLCYSSRFLISAFHSLYSGYPCFP